MSQETEQKYALVTGASSGIGKAVSIELAQRGFKVFACARNFENMKDLVEYGIEPISLDVTNAEKVLEVRDLISNKTGGKLDLLYNNAGASCTMPAIDVDDDSVYKCFAVNFFAPIRMTREFAPLLIKAKGCVAFTGSLAGIAPFPWGSIYSASKAAIHQYCSVLHLELQPFGVKVLNIVTGGVHTNIADKRALPATSHYYLPETLEAFEERKKMSDKNHPMEPDVFARKVVDDMLSKSDPLNVYRGTKATYVSTVVAWLPRSIIEFAFRIKFKLNPVFEAIRRRSTKEHIE
ncbi:hypothetical protein PACTADRAFT_51073 [Pachysolen tannophilus NRRL Y-2460]|uniref:NADPH-dependent 1-acyldihydroxyacetone phosphate reductase n=1 Tax=Pachysolen tannophilus NRRL Y-2460 TaxID=669874 RepID=A0A1E4TR34_PACTA|nr:hypothetical protein PACTADRAFT_51073 [Pachysolen tannophilus NRRL Y-2460]